MKLRDPYLTLGIDKAATPEKIRRAYRKKAAAVHPDNQATGNADEFLQVTAAGRLLEDATAKQIFDETGMVSGEDKVTEAAIMLIVEVAAKAIAHEGAPGMNVVILIQYALKLLRDNGQASIRLIQKSIKDIEERWQGGDAVKRILIMNMNVRIADLQTKAKAEECAIKLMQEVTYKQSGNAADEMIDMFMSRRRIW